VYVYCPSNMTMRGCHTHGNQPQL